MLQFAHTAYLPDKITVRNGGYIMNARIAVVTGASRGIGKEIAAKLAAEGCHLILNCKTSGPLLIEYAAQLSKRYGISCKTVIGDISLPATCRQIAAVTENFGRLDLLVHNAGISKTGLLHDLPESAWNELLSVNLSSCYQLCRHLTPIMIAQKSGKILFLSSVWGLRGASYEVAYSASKGGVNAFTKAPAKELAPSGIAVNALACGMIDTEMNAAYSETEKQAIAEEIPAGRIAAPEEAAQMALLLLKAPSYLTAQIIAFDGGWQS